MLSRTHLAFLAPFVVALTPSLTGCYRDHPPDNAVRHDDHRVDKDQERVDHDEHKEEHDEHR